MSQPARVLIGIPSFRRPAGLRRLLLSIAEQRNLEDVEVEVFVADNDAAKREGAALCRQLADAYSWPIRCAVIEEPGISATRNAILNEANARGVDFVAMLDDDEQAEPDWLHELLEMQRSTGADVVGGPVEYELERPWSVAILHSGAFQPRPWRAGPVPMLDATGNVLLSCEALARNGWPKFDPSFGTSGGEDKEFFTRLSRAGTRFAWAPAAVAREHVPGERANAKWLLRRVYRIGNCDLRITRLHDGPAATLVSAGKAAVVLVTAPLGAPLLLLPSRRLWLMRKWARAAGKLAALAGRHQQDNAERPDSEGD